MGIYFALWTAYSLQEVLSYLILSPRCLYDGSKVAYGGREGLVTPPDGAKLASRWLQVASRWLQAVNLEKKVIWVLSHFFKIIENSEFE